MKDLPGYEWAIEHGYALMSHAADRTKASYAKDGIFLDVFDDKIASLWARVGMVDLSVSKFSFPGNIEIFERQIEKVYAPFREEWW